MRIATISDRAALVVQDGAGGWRAADVHRLSDGKYGPDTAGLYPDWDAFVAWAADAVAGLVDDQLVEFDPAQLGPPSPSPRQILAIGLNYSDHAAESGFEAPESLPPVFPKFLSSLSGPYTDVVLPPGGHTDWEVELVVVIGKHCFRVDREDAWEHVAGLTVGNDISERIVQLRGPAPQFGLGKSFPGFAPTGPWLVTPDELPDRDDLALRCTLDDEVVQDGRTAKLIAPVDRLVAELSEVVHLYPGDLIFTGTPEGVGLGRDPQRFVAAGQTLISWIEGIGELRQRFTEGEPS